MADGMNLNERALRLLQWQPLAQDIREAGRCHCVVAGKSWQYRVSCRNNDKIKELG
jgi:hypothetical protein